MNNLSVYKVVKKIFRPGFVTIILFGLIGIAPGCCQYEGIFHQPYKEKIIVFGKLTTDLLLIENPDSAFGIIQQLEKKAISENDLETKLEIRLIKARYVGSKGLASEKVLVDEMLEVVDIASKHHLLITKARAIQVITWYYWNMAGNYEMASDYLLKLDEALQTLSDDEFPGKADCLHSIGSCYHFFGDFQQAKGYFHQVSLLKETSYNASVRASSINSLGVCYRDLGLEDSSDLIFLNFLQNKNSLAYEGWEGIVSGNLGYNYYLRGEFDKAIPLLIHDKEKALRTNDNSLAVGAMTPLADIYISQDRLDEAGNEIRDARQYILVTKQNDRLRQLFPVMSKWYSKIGNSILAVAYMDSTLIALEKYQEKKNTVQLLRASQRSEIEKKKATQIKVRQEKQQMIFFRNFIILTLVFGFTLVVVIMRGKQNRLKQKQQIQELKMLEAEAELAFAKKQLAEFSRRVSEKNEFIEKLEEQSRLTENNELLLELKQSAILTEDDWIEFKLSYEQVYPLFFHKLNEKFPGLAPSEIRYITLAKLGFSSNEIARSLGISTGSVYVTWHRIRKKLELPETKTVQDMIVEIS